MERIADMAVSIAMRIDNISKFNHPQAISYDFSIMSDKVNGDAKLAKSIFLDDDVVDSCRNRCYENIKERIRKAPDHPGYHINTYLLPRHLEPIADRAITLQKKSSISWKAISLVFIDL